MSLIENTTMNAPTFLHELRDTARQCSNPQFGMLLRLCADHVAQCISDLSANPTVMNMVALNGAWAKATAVLGATPPEADPSAPSSAGDAGAVDAPMRMAA